ncbi:major tail fiber protein [Acidovorax sp. KKS102]|nr:major tail fiber protein [Acidovorax sp. KKS102]
MDDLLSKLNPWTEALNAKGSAFALGVSATSATLLDFTPGIKNLVVQPGKGFVPGMDLVLADSAVPTNRMLTTCTAYNVETGALQVEVYSSTGTGTPSAWSISMTAAVDAAAFVTPTGIQTLTNKTLESPALTGIPTTPTAAPGTNTTQVASTAFVRAAVTALINSSPAALDTLNELAAALGNDANFAATMTSALAAKAPLASPALTGIPTAPTATPETDSTQLATTAFAQRLATGRRRMTAQGAVAANKVVVLNSNGSVSTVGYSVNPGALGAEQTPAISGDFVQMIDCPGSNKVVLLTTTHLHVGTVDGNTGTTTWGAGTALPTGSLNRICWHPVESVVCMTFFNASAAYLQLGTISGSTISLGSAQSLGAAVAPTGGTRLSLCYNAHQNKIVVLYLSTTTNINAVAVQVASGVMTSGTAVSAGTTSGSYFAGAVCSRPGVPEVVVSYATAMTAYAARALTVNATALTARTAVTVSGSFDARQTAWMEYVPSADRFVVVAGNNTTSSVLAMLALSGTAVSVAMTFATAATFWSGGSVDNAQQPFAYDIVKGELVFFGLESSTAYARTASAAVTGSTLVFGPTTYINTSTSSVPVMTYNSSEDKAVFAYVDAGNSNLKTTRVWDTGDSVTNANAWIGITAAAIADGAQGLVITKGGVASGLSGLATGYTYYIDDLGELQQTGSRRAGVALSATELLLTGNM